MRMCHTHRMMFLELAEALYREGKRDRCQEVMDFADQGLPAYNIPYDYTSASMAAIRYALGDKEKANEVMRAVAESCVEYLRWGDTLGREQRRSVQTTLQQQLAIFGYVLQSANHYQATELVDEYYPIYEQYANYCFHTRIASYGLSRQR